MRPNTSHALTANDRERLAAILGRLSFSFSGERDAAALAATRFMQQRGLAWRDVLTSPPPEFERPSDAARPDFSADWRRAASFCASQGASVLTEWELSFVRSLLGFRRLSERQAQVLRSLLRKLYDAAECAA